VVLVLLVFPKTNEIGQRCRKYWKMNFRYVVISLLSAGNVMERICIFKTIYRKWSIEILR